MRYACSHCGHRFEAEEREGIECPRCFWSSSVQSEEDVHAEKTVVQSAEARRPSRGKGLPAFLIPLAKTSLLVVLISGCAGVFWWQWPALEKVLSGFLKKLQRPAAFTIEAPPEGGGFRGTSNPDPAEAFDRLSPDEKASLEKVLFVGKESALSGEEKNILLNKAEFKTGWVERLPSEIWSLERFQAALAEKEAFYKIKLPRSYHKKLETLFREKYLPSGEAFGAGEILRARDQWVGSLAFPIYANDLRKHRGVALAMLRPFIEDTLAKISVANNLLMEKTVRENEETMNAQYASLFAEVEKEDWPAAAASIEKLLGAITDYEKKAAVKASAPPYPAEIQAIDTDIQRTLYAVLEVPAPTLADWQALRRDLEAKQEVLRQFDPRVIAVSRSAYERGNALITQRAWAEAVRALTEVTLPRALAEDARLKISILQKLLNPALDSQPENG